MPYDVTTIRISDGQLRRCHVPHAVSIEDACKKAINASDCVLHTEVSCSEDDTVILKKSPSAACT